MSNKIRIKATTPATFENSLDIKGFTCLENTITKIVFDAPTTPTTTSFGLGIGRRSSNPTALASFGLYLDMQSSGTGQLVLATTFPYNFLASARSNDGLVWSTGDSLELTIEQKRSFFLCFGSQHQYSNTASFFDISVFKQRTHKQARIYLTLVHFQSLR